MRSFFFSGVPEGPSWNRNAHPQLGLSGTPLKNVLLFIALLSSGCVQRQLTVTSNPTGAVVYLNDRELGRTPFQHKFQWYGTYDVVVRKDGYETLKTYANVIAPFWQWVPLDALTDFLPLTDEHALQFSLQPEQPVDPSALVLRGQQMQEDLQSSVHTLNRAALEVHPTSKPATQPDVREPD